MSAQGLVVGRAYGRDIHAREVLAMDEAGTRCWIRIPRFGDMWLLIDADPQDVATKVRKARQIPPGTQSDRFPEHGNGTANPSAWRRKV